MSKINHERDVLRQIDQRKRQAAEDRRQAKEYETEDRLSKSISQHSSSPLEKEPSALSGVIAAAKHYLTYGDWSTLKKVLSELDSCDVDLAMKVIEMTLDGVTIERSDDHVTGFWITANSPAASKAFQDFKQLSLQGCDLRDQSVLQHLERNTS